MVKEFHISEKTYKRINEIQSYVVFILLFFVVHAFFKVAFVPSRSMYPTLAQKELLFCSYVDAAELDYGEITIFYPEADRQRLFVKRLIGKPGDQIIIADGHLYRNGEEVEEPYLMETEMLGEFPGYTVPEDCYFFMGDNRNNSYDCRFFGAIPGEQVVGKVLFHFRVFSDEELIDFQEAVDSRGGKPQPGSDQYLIVT